MKSIYQIILVFVFIISTGSSCEKKEVNVLLQDMASFDRAFIPVLFYVRHGEMDNARKSVFFLNHTWKRFNEKYKNLNPENDNWGEAFRMADAWLSDAYTSIDASSPEDTYIFLDHVRYQMVELREQNNFEYFLDDVWEFEARLDLVEEVAVDQMLCLLDYCEFEYLVADMNDAWEVVEPTIVDVELFGLDGKKIKELNYNESKLKSALREFNLAVEEADGENLAVTAAFLRVAYLDYLSSYGDFISSKSYFASL